MNWKFSISLTLALLVAPLAYAHEPAGTPKNYCEGWWEWNTHDYNSDPPSFGFSTKALGTAVPVAAHPGGDPKYQWPYMDGNQMGDCSGWFNPGTPCAGFEDPADPLSFFVGLCDYDPFMGDFDGHKEFGYLAHALIAVESPVEYCWHETPHHPPYGPVSVIDVLLGAGASFTVYADRYSLWYDPCGDFMFDESTDCVGTCTVTFGPGIDGAYHVVVQGTQGHVIW